MIWDISVIEYIRMGGWVMIPLLALTGALALLVVERFLYFAALRKTTLTTDGAIEQIVAGRIAETEKRCLLGELLRRFAVAQRAYGVIDRGVVEEVVRGYSGEFVRHLRSIAALTAAAPLLGLLGTVSGMITTFNVMNIFGTGNAKAMSGGISEAMITTQFGLVVAILGMYLSMLLTRRARTCEESLNEIMVHILRKLSL